MMTIGRLAVSARVAEAARGSTYWEEKMAKNRSSVTEGLRKIADALSKKPAGGAAGKPAKKKKVTEVLDEIAEELRKKHP